ncbi:hypothetical protein OF117_03745 [Geodermatophilus sp. YIM 151500]|uniref:hypothetical protein n=1 Tax=Geodermatophilus sp. YIM 151500 TaxID=2984531 RepID=UPI0021E48155|nr:hypothetical protein [Geodermatophilus sp. YIM 151500]MCV2488466.1 hypothetical protein [Geodermatophilus sp. YIM 151500]
MTVHHAPVVRAGPAWPRWLGVTAVVIGGLAVPLTVLVPVPAALLGVVALFIGIGGARAHHGAAGSLYRLAAVLGAASLLVLAFFAVTLVSVTTEPMPDVPEVVSVPVP